jgi:hypothetical protein
MILVGVKQNIFAPMIKNSIHIILLINILAIPLFAQADYKAMAKMPLCTFWKKGEGYTYELTKGKITYFKDVEETKTKNRQLVKLTVLEVASKGFLMEADYESGAYFLPEELKKISGIDSLVQKYKHFKVQYAINDAGEFLRLGNLNQTREMLLDFYKAVYQKLEKTELTERVMQNMFTQMTSEAYITEGVFAELRLLHQFYGTEFAPESHNEYDTELANMLEQNGKSIPARASLNTSLCEGNYMEIEHNLTPNATIMKQLTFDYLKKMSNDGIQAENTEGVDMKVLDYGQFIYHLRSGWLTEFFKKRTVTLGEEKTVDFVKMVLIEKGAF